MLDEAVQLRVVERDDRLAWRATRAISIWAASNDRGDDHEMAEVGRARPERERDPLAVPVGLADPGDLAVAADHDPARGAGRLDGRLDDDAQELPRIVRGDERLAEPLGRVPDPRPLGLESSRCCSSWAAMSLNACRAARTRRVREPRRARRTARSRSHWPRREVAGASPTTERPRR